MLCRCDSFTSSLWEIANEKIHRRRSNNNYNDRDPTPQPPSQPHKRHKRKRKKLYKKEVNKKVRERHPIILRMSLFAAASSSSSFLFLFFLCVVLRSIQILVGRLLLFLFCFFFSSSFDYVCDDEKFDVIDTQMGSIFMNIEIKATDIIKPRTHGVRVAKERMN